MWRVTPAVITEAVWAAKQFLDDIFDKCETFQLFESVQGQGPAGVLFDKDPGPDNYARLRLDGVGRNYIVKFLGKKWDESVKEALSALEEDSARAQAERLRKRQEREAAKAEAKEERRT